MRKRTQKNRKRFSKKQRKLRLSKKQRKLRLSKKRGQKKMKGGAPPVAGEFCAFKADCDKLENLYNKSCSTTPLTDSKTPTRDQLADARETGRREGAAAAKAEAKAKAEAEAKEKARKDRLYAESKRLAWRAI